MTNGVNIANVIIIAMNVLFLVSDLYHYEELVYFQDFLYRQCVSVYFAYKVFIVCFKLNNDSGYYRHETKVKSSD